MIKTYVTLFLSLLVAQFTAAQTTSVNQDHTRIESGTESEITAHGVCKKITYNGPGGIFAPTRTAEEWNSFLAAAPVTTGDCGTPIDCFTDSDGDGYGTGGSVSTTTTATCPVGQAPNNTDCNDAAYSTSNTCSASNTYNCNDGTWDNMSLTCPSDSSNCAGTTVPHGDSVCCSSAPTSTCATEPTPSGSIRTCLSDGTWQPSMDSCTGLDAGCSGGSYSSGQTICCSGSHSATCSGGGGGCFIAGSYVTTHDRRFEKIENIKVGDRLLTADGRDNEVMKLLRLKYIGKIYGLNGEKAFFTPNHPIKTVDGWKSLRPDLTKKEVPELEVKQLVVGDIVIKDTGLEPIMYLTQDYVEEIVYNFTLNGDHEYLVNNLAVHNKLDCSCGGGTGTAGWSSAGGKGTASGATQPNASCAGGVDNWCGSGGPSASVTCYRDSDGDGYGNSSSPRSFPSSCGSGYVTDSTDCDDTTFSSSNTCSGCGGGYDYCCMESEQCCKSNSTDPYGFCEFGDQMVNGVDMGNGSWGYMEGQCTFGFKEASGTCLTSAP